uniref:Uncharacterized protein n=1 Tax=Knipowitschia caucasica TaxID=637954 RepID=A0AAV2KK61_KNICA
MIGLCSESSEQLSSTVLYICGTSCTSSSKREGGGGAITDLHPHCTDNLSTATPSSTRPWRTGVALIGPELYLGG